MMTRKKNFADDDEEPAIKVRTSDREETNTLWRSQKQ